MQESFHNQGAAMPDISVINGSERQLMGGLLIAALAAARGALLLKMASVVPPHDNGLDAFLMISRILMNNPAMSPTLAAPAFQRLVEEHGISLDTSLPLLAGALYNGVLDDSQRALTVAILRYWCQGN